MIIDRLYYNEYINSVNGLNYHEFDYNKITSKELKRILSYYNTLVSKHSLYENNIIGNFLYDIDTAINKSELTETQANRLNLWFLGYSESEIADREGVSRWVVSKSLHAACNKILDKLRGCNNELFY